jgi:hypothetical protein
MRVRVMAAATPVTHEPETKEGAQPKLRPLTYYRTATTYQKNCRRASRMFGSSLTKPRALELYFLLSTIT